MASRLNTNSDFREWTHVVFILGICVIQNILHIRIIKCVIVEPHVALRELVMTAKV